MYQALLILSGESLGMRPEVAKNFQCCTTDCVFCNVIGGGKFLSRKYSTLMKPKGSAERHQTLSLLTAGVWAQDYPSCDALLTFFFLPQFRLYSSKKSEVYNEASHLVGRYKTKNGEDLQTLGSNRKPAQYIHCQS